MTELGLPTPGYPLGLDPTSRHLGNPVTESAGSRCTWLGSLHHLQGNSYERMPPSLPSLHRRPLSACGVPRLPFLFLRWYIRWTTLTNNTFLELTSADALVKGLPMSHRPWLHIPSTPSHLCLWFHVKFKSLGCPGWAWVFSFPVQVSWSCNLLPLAVTSLPSESEHISMFREDLRARAQLLDLGVEASGRERKG